METTTEEIIAVETGEPVPEVQPEPALEPMPPAHPDTGFVDAQLAEFVSVVRDSLEWLEDGDDDSPRFLYVQSVVIANDGVPVARLRWDPNTGEYEHSHLLAQDDRP